MYVVATAGHVDHGKSTLVRALTGMEPDRWAEEQRRGMTIDLGFAWTRLPSGAEVAFVDVPGHARFVPNMLAGVGPVPAVLFVVAADEGWQPQSEEHLAALDAFGVRHGLLAVTRADLADPAAAQATALERLARSGLGAVPSVTVSGSTGAGLDDLRAALDRLVAALPAPAPDADVRMWVDRAFTVRGSGTVVTGTLGAGTLRVGDELEVAPTGRRATVRALQSLQRAADTVTAVARVAVNLRGVEVTQVRRGHALVTPGRWRATAEVDVRLPAAPERLPAELVLHVGSAAVAARVRPLDAAAARLRLATELPLRPGDRVLLRDPGRHLVLAGADVLDVQPPPLRRRGAATARARVLADHAAPDATAEVLRRGLVRAHDLAAFGLSPPPEGSVVAAGGWYVAPVQWQRWQARLVAAVDEHRRTQPLSAGLPLEAARRAVEVPDLSVLDALVADTPDLHAVGGRLVPREAAPQFPEPVARALEEVRARLAEAPFEAPEAPDLAAAGLTRQVLAAAVRAGLLSQVGDGVFLLPDAEDEAVRRLRDLPQPFTASEARQALATTRRVAIPLLEHLDRRRRTRRVDDRHRVVVEGGPPP